VTPLGLRAFARPGPNDPPGLLLLHWRGHNPSGRIEDLSSFSRAAKSFWGSAIDVADLREVKARPHRSACDQVLYIIEERGVPSRHAVILGASSITCCGAVQSLWPGKFQAGTDRSACAANRRGIRRLLDRSLRSWFARRCSPSRRFEPGHTEENAGPEPSLTEAELIGLTRYFRRPSASFVLLAAFRRWPRSLW